MYKLYADLKAKISRHSSPELGIVKPCAALLAHLLYDYQDRKKRLRKALRLLRTVPLYSNANQLKGDVFIWYCDREDHKANALSIARKLEPDPRRLAVVYLPETSKDSNKGVQLGCIWKAITIALKCRTSLYNSTLLVCVITHALYHRKVIHQQGLTSRINRLVSYNSSNLPECFLVQACKDAGIDTFSMQHGFYYRYAKEPPIDVINYENVTAHRLLVWSEFCRDEIIAFHQTYDLRLDFEMPVAGYLKNGEIQPQPAAPICSENRDHILCLLPGKKDKEGCIELLRVLSSLPDDIAVTVRAHPLLKEDPHLIAAMPSRAMWDTATSLAESFKSKPFTLAVGFNSTSLLEALIANIPCALFPCSTTRFDTDRLSKFDSTESLLRLVHNQIPTNELANYFLGADTFRYREIVYGDY